MLYDFSRIHNMISRAFVEKAEKETDWHYAQVWINIECRQDITLMAEFFAFLRSGIVIPGLSDSERCRLITQCEKAICIFIRQKIPVEIISRTNHGQEWLKNKGEVETLSRYKGLFKALREIEGILRPDVRVV